MADINVTLTQTTTVSATLAQTPVINVTMLGSGPPGPPGPAGGSTVTYPAGENLSSGRVVIIDGGEAYYFQPADATHAGRAFGITTSSATSGNNVTIQITGIVQDAAFTFSPDNRLWINADGEILQTQPGSGVLVQKAGVAVENDKMAIDFAIQILKN